MPIRLQTSRTRKMSCEAIKIVAPSDANFLLIRVDNSIYRYKQLIVAGIVVRNSSKSLGCENTLRISVGTPKENNILIKVLQSLDN